MSNLSESFLNNGGPVTMFAMGHAMHFGVRMRTAGRDYDPVRVLLHVRLTVEEARELHQVLTAWLDSTAPPVEDPAAPVPPPTLAEQVAAAYRVVPPSPSVELEV